MKNTQKNIFATNSKITLEKIKPTEKSNKKWKQRHLQAKFSKNSAVYFFPF